MTPQLKEMRKWDLLIFFWILLLTIALFSSHNFLQTGPPSPLSPSKSSSKSSSVTTKIENLLRRTVFSGPGLYFQDKLFIWGARVTHSLDDEKIYIDMFVFGTRYIHLIQSKYKPPLIQALLEEDRVICKISSGIFIGNNKTTPFLISGRVKFLIFSYVSPKFLTKGFECIPIINRSTPIRI